MKVAYLVETDAYVASGVNQKVKRQVACWREAAIDSKLVVVSPAAEGADSRRCFFEEPATVITHRTYGTVGVATKAAKALALRKARRVLAEYGADVIYYRFSSWTPCLLATLKTGSSLVVEYNTLLDGESRVTMSLLKRLWFRASAKAIAQAADAFVCVTDEIRDSLKTYGKPAVVIANGFSVETAIQRTPNPGGPVRFVFTGSGGLPWHGLDKIYELARLLGQHEFYIIGPTPLDEVRCPENVIFCGKMRPDELSGFYAGMDVGISTLALFRNGMEEACPLKSREYLAHGLPVVGCYRDPDMDGQDFYLRIPNREDSIPQSVSLVESFAQGWKTKSIDLRHIRAVIGDETKERARVAFFRRYG